VKEHEQMVQALSERDAKGLGQLLSEHLINKRNTVLDLMQSGDV